jgi:SOS-response transcriptional repressor LexA/DNA-binding XRE family transcriptional regulator
VVVPENPNTPDWAVSILNLRKRLGLSQSAFGSILHYSAMAVSRWETGKLEPSARCYIELGNLAGDPEGWSFWTRAGLKRSDLGHMSPGDPSVMQKRSWPDFEIVHAGSGIKRKKRKGAAKAKLVLVPLLEVQAGTLGQGGSQFTDFASATSEEMIAAPANWCPNPGETNCMRVKGTSMSPLINDGDVVAVDGSQTDPKKLNGKIVVGWHRLRGLSLARLIVAEGVQLLESEDREYMPVPVERDRKWQIIGRVLWWIRQGP